VAHCADVGNAAPGGSRAKCLVGGVVVDVDVLEVGAVVVVDVDVREVGAVVVVDVVVEADVVVVGATVVVVVGGGAAESTRIAAALLFQWDSWPHPELKMPTFTT
jgi:hypothetical protein